MPNSLKYEYIKNIIEKEDELISESYKNNKQLLEIKCNLCNEIYKQTFDRYYRGYRHQKCANVNNLNNIIALKKRYGEIFLKSKTYLK